MLRVKHKLLSFLDFVFINASDFDPEIHTILPEPGSETAPVSTPNPDVPTSVAETIATAPAESATEKDAEAKAAQEKIQEADAKADAESLKKRRTPNA